jgi:hypothetical protein
MTESTQRVPNAYIWGDRPDESASEALLCGLCGSANLHLCHIRVYHAGSKGVFVHISADGVETDATWANNNKRRGVLLAASYTCEECHLSTKHKFYFHKGSTYWEIHAGGAPDSVIWRD